MMGSQTLGNYQILDELGRGGMGTVYRARDLVLERTVALKVLHPHYTRTSADGGSRFLNEARAIARLSHPAIVSVFEFSDADPASIFIAMEYVDGTTIEEFVRKTGEDVGATLDLVGQLLGGLGYAHERGVVHRDIKPSNLLVTSDGRLKITDFGIAKVDALKHTQTGMMVGTPAYMAPERYTSSSNDRRCDVYSVGVLCYELLTGRRPFSGELSELVYKSCHAVPAAVTTVRPDLPRWLDDVIAKALAKDPEARYQSAPELDAALRVGREGRASGRDRDLPLGAAGARIPPVTAEGAATDGATAPVPRPQPLASPAPAVAVSARDIAAIERQLAPILGPLAKISVRRAAGRAKTLAELYTLLSLELRSDDERERFMAVAPREARSEPCTELSSPRASGQGPPECTGDLFAPATLERATKILTRYMGPIAVVIVKKAAVSAADETDLYARLAERITDSRERARCVNELTRAN